MKRTIPLEPLYVETAAGERFVGGAQNWYPDRWRQRAGCGPTTASNLIWYLTGTRPEYGALCRVQNRDASGFLALMQEMFGYVTPGPKGVNTSRLFADGVRLFAQAHRTALRLRALEVPAFIFKRPEPQEAAAFIGSALADGMPAAFLNLSCGQLTNLDSWHWVTLVALDDRSLFATIADQGRVFEIDFGQWLKTSVLGGALVRLEL